MAIVVESGVGLSTAESFASIAFMDIYHAARGHIDWFNLSTTQKEQHARLSTDYMEAIYRNLWGGARVSATQSLSWPRYASPMRDVSAGYLPLATYYPSAYYPSDSVPVVVMNAQAELAYKSKDGPLIPDITQRVKSKRVGPIEIVYADYAPQTKRYRLIDMMLLPFLNGSGGMMNIQVVRS